MEKKSPNLFFQILYLFTYFASGSTPSATGGADSTITVVKGSNYSGNGNLSVSTHPAEEGTSVDDDMPSASEAESEDR